MEKLAFSTYLFDEFQLNLKRRCLLDGRLEVIELRPKAFEVLKYLCEHPRTLIKREDLVREVWNGLSVGTDSAKESIWEIRKALGEKGKTIIKTKHGHGGWSFECDVFKRKDGLDNIERTVGADVSEEVNSIQVPDEGLALIDDLSDEPRTELFNVTDVTPAKKGTENETMSAPDLIGETQTASVDVSNDGNETFERWLSGPGLPIFILLLVCIVATVVVSIGVAKNMDDAMAMRIASGVQCLVILLMFLHSWFWTEIKRFRPNEECSEADMVKAGFQNKAEFENERAGLENNLRKYALYWRGLLLSWVPLYFVFALGEFGFNKVLLVIFNLGNTLMCAACFNSLNKNVDEQDQEHLAGWVLNAVMLLILAGALFALLLTKDMDGATLLTGIMAGITMALYIGRLQSRFLGPRFWILYLLYSYTAIQPLVLYIQDHQRWGWIVLNFALLLKCLLYIYMAWLFQSGLLLFYFASVKRTDTALRKQRKAFRKLL